MAGLLKDVRQAARGLVRSPGFTLAVCLTFAIGIGGTTAVFSVIDHVLFRPLSYRDPGQLFVIHEMVPKLTSTPIPVSATHFVEWRRSTTSFESMALIGDVSLTLTGGGEPQRVLAARASAELFPMLGIRPQLGRAFLPEEDQPGRDRVVLLNDELWRQRFDANPAIVGSRIVLNGDPYEVIGVLPPDFHFPKLAHLFQLTVNEGRPQLWKPLALRTNDLPRFGSFNFSCIAALRPTATPERAVAELNALQAILARNAPEPMELRAAMIPLAEQITGRSRAALRLLMAAVGAVLLIGVVNIANLLLTRAITRRRQIAVRMATGASTGRIVRESLLESLVLALTGGLAGIVVGWTFLRLLVAYAPIDLPRMDEVHLDGRVLLFAVSLSAVCAAICGALPAWHAARTDPQEALKSSRTSTAGPAARRIGGMLAAAEVALSVVCLAAAGLLFQSFERLLAVDPGFRTANVLALELTLSSARHPDLASRLVLYDSLLNRLQADPRVVAAAINNRLPATGQGSNNVIVVEGTAKEAPLTPLTDTRTISPGYFSVMNIPLLDGRIFGDEDRGGRRVALVSRSLADRGWPDQNPLGKRLQIGSPQSPFYEVIGIVGDVRGVALSQTAPSPTLYVPHWLNAFSDTAMVIRTRVDPGVLHSSIRTAIRAVDPELPIPTIRTLDDVVREPVAARGFQMRLVALFGIVGLLLATLGVYSVVSHSVTQRTAEIGLRIALGASPAAVKHRVILQGVKPVGIGLVVGVTLAVAAARTIEGMLFGVRPHDPATLLAVSAILSMAGVMACYLPAGRAARIDPLRTLRYE
jgi:putative ABC transport system permease protein